VDKTVVSRVKRQRALRAGEGWQEVKVWVPTEADAAAIRKLAAERRANAAALCGLVDEVNGVTQEITNRIATAIMQRGSGAYTTPSGPVLELMTQLADEDDLESFSRAVIILARAKPLNARFVEEAVPAKISNFLVKQRGIEVENLIEWQRVNPSWADNLRRMVRDPKRFQALVEAMAGEISQAKRQSKH
jgi:hypothetical protein